MQYLSHKTYPEQRPPQKLRASEKGRQKIKQSREDKGWKYSAEDDDRPLKAATKILEPDKAEWWEQQWRNGERQYAVAAATWKRFQSPGDGVRIKFEFFDAFCQILDLSWQEVAELDDPGLFIAGDPPDLNRFYGRIWYLNKLNEWIVQDRSRLVVLYGQPGIGKTALVRQWVEQVRKTSPSAFEEYIWITPESSFSSLLQVQGEQFHQPLPGLLELLKKQSSLIVLDGWTDILELCHHQIEPFNNSSDPALVLRKLAKQKHTNVLILIGDEKPMIASDDAPLIRSVRLQGLGKVCANSHEFNADKQFLEAEQLRGTEAELNAFLSRYDNPSVLKSVADIARVVHGGYITELLDEKASIMLPSDLYPDIDARFNRVWKMLSRAERIVMYWLAIRRESYSIQQLKALVAHFGIHSNGLTEVLYALMNKQSLVERDDHTAEFRLTPVWQKFATTKFVEENTDELMKAIESGKPNYTELFFGYAFLPLEIDDLQVEVAQMRRVVNPILNELTARLGNKLGVFQGLEQLLTLLQEHGDARGYGIHNLETLLAKLNDG